MKNITASIAFLILAFVGNGYSQYCGGGFKTIDIYVSNGLNAQNLKYQLISVLPRDISERYKSEKTPLNNTEKTAKFLSETFFPHHEERLSRFWNTDEIIRSEVVEKFLKTYDEKKYAATPEDRHAGQRKLSGDIKYSAISFYTIETFDQPYLLKIFADNYRPVYILGNHLGLCTRTEDVILKDFFEPQEKKQ